MLKEIISGGQAGAERAALDAAIKCNIPHGGWTLRGRKHESGILPPHYNLKEIESTNYSILIEKNVRDSDATLIISNGNLSKESSFTRDVTFKHQRPNLHIDLMKTDSSSAALQISNWISEHHIERLNISGPRESNDPDIYQGVLELLLKLLLMEHIDFNLLIDTLIKCPFRTPEEAIGFLIQELPLKEKVLISNIPEQHFDYFKRKTKKIHRFACYQRANKKSQPSDGEAFHQNDTGDDETLDSIIRGLWNVIRGTHSLKIIK